MLHRNVDRIERLLYLLAGAGLLASVGLAFTAVILRYLFSHSMEWIEEAARYLALFAALLVVGPVLRQRGHVSLDIFTSGLTGKRKEVYRLAMNLVALSVAAAVFVWGMQLLIQTYTLGLRTASLQFPQWLPYSLVPLGMAVLMLFSLFEILAALRSLRRGEDVPVEIDPTREER